VEYFKLLMGEMKDQLSYSQFKSDIRSGLDAQGEFDRLRNKEKELNLEIKRLQEDFKKAQDEFAKEALENN
jgi:cell division protein FtsB